MMTDRVRLQHMLDAALEIGEMLKNSGRDRKTELAITRLIELPGEAAKHVSPDVRQQYPEIPWSNIIGMRNILVHEYFRIEQETIWDVAEHRVPAVRDWLIGILEHNPEL